MLDYYDVTYIYEVKIGAHGPWHGPSRECCFSSEDCFSKELEVRGGEARWNVEQHRELSFKELH